MINLHKVYTQTAVGSQRKEKSLSCTENLTGCTTSVVITNYDATASSFEGS